MAQDPITGSETVATALKTNVNNDIAELFQAIEDLTVQAAGYPGFMIRPRFSRGGNALIYAGPGAYHHDGTSEQQVYWADSLSLTLSGGSGPDIY